MMANIAKHHYEDFDPFSELKSENEFDTLLLHLPDFKKEQLSVQVTSTRILKIRGERPISDTKSRRFQKEVHLSTNINTHEITPKFLEGILYIRQPKLVTSAVLEQEDHQIEETDAEELASESEPEILQQEASSEANFEEKDEELEETSEALKARVDGLSVEPESQILQEEVSSEKTDELKGLNQESEHGGGIFEVLQRPEHWKRLAVNGVVLLIVLGYFVLRMFRLFTKKVEEITIVEYDHQEL